jgi:hypothetical protein
MLGDGWREPVHQDDIAPSVVSVLCEAASPAEKQQVEMLAHFDRLLF